MKKMFFCLLISASPIFSQSSVESFFKDNVKLICGLAHPSVDYKYSEVTRYGSNIKMSIYYYNSISEVDHQLKLSFRVNSNGFPERISVESDSAFFPPFSATELIKDFLIDALKDSYNEAQANSDDPDSYFERKLIEKLLNEMGNMSGQELTLSILQLGWLDSH